tara:strand:- start:30252 stop:31220 length:969 start_codon:yes stop_codon:yes gene_type:complete
MNLIKKYYPKTLDEFIIDNDLKQLIKTHFLLDDLNFIFIGEHSSGKSNLISIILNTYYGDNNNNDSINNIFNINNLCDLGINTFRQRIKTFCQTCCSIKNKKKIIIIDEIDGLNQQNQQILRNIFDKFKHKVHFICSCVNIQKVSDNIQSRLTSLILHKLNKNQIINLFQEILQRENLKISNDDLNTIIQISNLNMNVIFNNIQKLILLDKHIDKNLIIQNCTNISYNKFEKYYIYIRENNIELATNILIDFFNNGFSVNDILENFFEFVKYTDTIDNNCKFEIFKIIGEYITYFYTIHEDKIELYLFTNKIINVLENKISI